MIALNEVVFDLDGCPNPAEALAEIGCNLYKAGYAFELWGVEGQRSFGHIHVFFEVRLPPLYKELFLKKYTPEKYHRYLDLGLCKRHRIATPNEIHYKYH